jgi:hypothetical protein
MARQLRVVWPMSFGIKSGSQPWMLLPLAWLDPVMPACNNVAVANPARHTMQAQSPMGVPYYPVIDGEHTGNLFPINIGVRITLDGYVVTFGSPPSLTIMSPRS